MGLTPPPYSERVVATEIDDTMGFFPARLDGAELRLSL